MSLIDSIPHPSPYLSSPDCTGCRGRDIATADIYNGRRCADCPPQYDPTVAVAILMAGWPGAAAGYVRTFAQSERTPSPPRSANGPASDPAEWYERAHLDHP